jgi:DNA-binding NtrC family response regulator
VDSVNTAPEQESRIAAPEKISGVLWVHPREWFVPFASQGLTLGRGADASAVLESTQVSRVHAHVRKVGPVHVLSDAGSRNGTHKNGRRIDEAALDPGDVLRLGDWLGVVLELEPEQAASTSLFSEPEPGVVVGPRSRPEWRRLEQLARSRTPILLEGPTGVGKEVLARALHRLSGRKGAFVGVNCTALPEALAEAQLFGQARAADAVAVPGFEGLLATADQGTLLLDEIAALPLSQQAPLLRVLELTPGPLDVRFVATSQGPLWELVRSSDFRADLLGRLSGSTLRLLPLRQRREEIPRLFSAAFERAGGAPARLKAAAFEALCLAPWPLNVRQLVLFATAAASSLPGDSEIGRSAIQELLAASGAELAASPEPSRAPAATEAALGRRRALWLARHEGELAELRRSLDENRGNVSEAARQVGLSRSAAMRLLEADAARKSSQQKP